MSWFQLLIAEVRRRLFEESFVRLRKCLHLLDEEQIWWRPNDLTNSVGNLTLHLCGNARQWICAGLGKQPDTRHRQAEFDERGPIPRADLLAMLDTLEKDIDEVLEMLTPEEVLTTHPVQTFRETGMSILVHVVEHFSYHVGQVTLLTKWLKNTDTGYYEGVPLE